LLAGALTPPLQAHLSRLGCRHSFADAAAELGHLKGVTVSAAMARRRTEADGAVYVALQDAEAARVRHEAPPPRLGPAVQQVSVDGAMVPLRDGSWREVRTLAIGTVVLGREPGTVRGRDWSYFSRLADAATFCDVATGEVHRRGVETAGRVAGVVDGALWCQTFFDAHRPDAVRILDFGHATEHLTPVAEALWGAGEAAQAWTAAQRLELREGTVAAVLATIRALPLAAAPDPTAAQQAQGAALGYLEPRQEQMRYAAFRAQGLPIGSGSVESANKLVVEHRLKGAGRRWAAAHVNPMVALRGALCSHRWAEAWTAIARARHAQRRPRVPPAAVLAPIVASAASVAAPRRRVSQPAIPALPRTGPMRVVNGRPTAAHPWKRGAGAPPAPIPKL